MLRLGRRAATRPGGCGRSSRVAVVGAIASAVDMRLSYQGGASITRLYEGTDTRCQDILVGAALAIGMAMWAEHRPAARRAVVGRPTVGRTERSHPAAGTTGHGPAPPPSARPTPAPGPELRPITAWEIDSGRGATRRSRSLGWSAVRRRAVPRVPPVGGWSPFLFEGGYFLFALGVALVIFCVVTAQRASLSRALGNPCSATSGRSPTGPISGTSRCSPCCSAERLHLYGYPLLVVRIARHPCWSPPAPSTWSRSRSGRGGSGRSPNGGRGWSPRARSSAWWPSPWRRPSRRRPRRPAPRAWSAAAVHRTAGEGPVVRRLGGLAGRLRHAGQPASERATTSTSTTGPSSAAGCSGAPSTWATAMADPVAPQCNTVHAEVRAVAGPVGGRPRSSSTPTW